MFNKFYQKCIKITCNEMFLKLCNQLVAHWRRQWWIQHEDCKAPDVCQSGAWYQWLYWGTNSVDHNCISYHAGSPGCALDKETDLNQHQPWLQQPGWCGQYSNVDHDLLRLWHTQGMVSIDWSCNTKKCRSIFFYFLTSVGCEKTAEF